MSILSTIIIKGQEEDLVDLAMDLLVDPPAHLWVDLLVDHKADHKADRKADHKVVLSRHINKYQTQD